MKTLLFLRDYHEFSGGHLKHWHYFQHALQSASFSPRICFTPESLWDASNPWLGIDKGRLATENEVADADVLFLAGKDWLRIPEKERRLPRRQVINLIQHVRHADKSNQLYQFLEHEAVRICVSQEVADAILATGRVRGPVVTIPNGIDLDTLPGARLGAERTTDILILGTKHRWLARYFAARLWRPNLRLRLITKPMPRQELLAAFASSHKVLLIPDKTEGFYLPAIEAMALGAVVVCPDCVGNRSFCINGENCLRPNPTTTSIMQAMRRAEKLSAQEVQSLIQAGFETAQEHRLDRERACFLDLLQNLEELTRSST